MSYSQLICFVACICAVSAQHQQPAQYPAGVDPSRCPSYPNCDNAALHNQQPAYQNQHDDGQWNAQQWSAPAAQQWNAPAPQQWNAPAPQQWNAPAAQQWGAPAPSWEAPAVQGPSSNHLNAAGGDKYPAGVNPQSCPNYPYCDTNGIGSHAPQVAPLPGFNERLYPAGVSPQECPNFPYCN